MKRLILVGPLLCLFALTACESKYKVVTSDVRAQMLDDLKASKLNLDCKASCMFTWIHEAPSVHALDIAERWEDLAIKVMQIGYAEDLSYYYLGQAAQGLGYHNAAIAYYQYALALANGMDATARCESAQSDVSDPCQGVDLASSIPVLIAASRSALAAESAASGYTPSRPRRSSNSSSSAASAPAKNSGTGNSGWALPPPTGQ